MKTIEDIRIMSELKNRQTVYYRIKISGIEEKENYIPKYNFINGKPVRVFSEDEAELLININKIKSSVENA